MNKGIVFLKRSYEQGYCVPKGDLCARVLCSSRGPMSKGIVFLKRSYKQGFVFLKRTYEQGYCVPKEDL